MPKIPQKRRTSKIARLPKLVRDKLNHLLEDCLSYRAIIKELGPSAKGLIERNISSWHHGGYKDWLIEQQWREDTRLRHEAAAAGGTEGGAAACRGAGAGDAAEWRFRLVLRPQVTGRAPCAKPDGMLFA